MEQLGWNDFFKLRRSRNRFQLGLGILGGFLGFQASTFYVLTQVKIDPSRQLIAGVDDTVLYIGGAVLAGLGSFAAFNILANPLFRLIKSQQVLQQFDLKERDFTRRIMKHRPKELFNVGAGDNSGHLDYFGERIQSVQDYKKWLAIQRDFKKTGKLPHRLLQ